MDSYVHRCFTKAQAGAIPKSRHVNVLMNLNWTNLLFMYNNYKITLGLVDEEEDL